MIHQRNGDVYAALREWLRCERLLGLSHLAVPPGPVPGPAPASGSEPKAVQRPPAPSAAGHRGGGAALPLRFAPASDAQMPPLCTSELSKAAAEVALEELNAGHVRNCRRCRLAEHRTQTVFGVGHPRPELVFVGEGPGADEDAQGLPFVGRAGQLLTKMIAAMTLTREQVYICNVVKCRPPGNRTPLEDEMEACAPFLYRQLAILRPRVIVALGRPAVQTLLNTSAPIGKLRGHWQLFPPPLLADLGLPTMKLMPTYHPAYLLRTPSAKAEAWEDLQAVMAELGLKPRKG